MQVAFEESCRSRDAREVFFYLFIVLCICLLFAFVYLFSYLCYHFTSIKCMLLFIIRVNMYYMCVYFSLSLISYIIYNMYNM